ncbi:MAG: hypothetical protein NTY19_04320 [Planctomycetota bacterium]|nr:hypothetical protein [Planctomycetota bacterium]
MIASRIRRKPKQPKGTGLLQFFNQHFLPLALQGQEGQLASQYRTAIRWLGEALERPAVLDDLSLTAVKQAIEAAQAAGAGYYRCETLTPHYSRYPLAHWRNSANLAAVHWVF